MCVNDVIATIRMALSKIKKKYFDQRIPEHLAEDYFMVGLIMGKEPSLDKMLL